MRDDLMKRDDAINTLFELFKVCKHNQRRYEVAAAASTESHLAALLEHYALAPRTIRAPSCRCCPDYGRLPRHEQCYVANPGVYPV